MDNNMGTTKYMSFKGSKDYNGPPKVGFEALASPGQVITISTAEGFNSNRKPYFSSILQTNTGCNNQVGTGYTVSTYTSKQVDAHSIGRAHYKRTPPISNITSQNISIKMDTPFAHRSALNHQSLGGGVATITSPINTAFVGTTDLRSAPKPSGGPAQLTIFYAGSVCVYDDVSPEKAQAIMLLAGNGNSPTNPPNKTPTPPPTPTTNFTSRLETQTQRPLCNANAVISINNLSYNQNIPSPIPISVAIPRHASCGVRDSFFLNESRKNSTPFSCTNFPSPISVSSLSTGGSADVTASRSFASLASNPENCKITISQGARVSTTTATTPSAVPQARKASLARFMEKRKERAVTIAPYPSILKQSPEYVTPKSESMSFSITSAGSFSLSSMK